MHFKIHGIKRFPKWSNSTTTLLVAPRLCVAVFAAAPAAVGKVAVAAVAYMCGVGASGREREVRPRGEGGTARALTCRFDGEDLDGRVQKPSTEGDAGEQPASRDRDEDGVERGDLCRTLRCNTTKTRAGRSGEHTRDDFTTDARAIEDGVRACE